MRIIKEYINYLKDNPEGYWFKAKLYGWGWTPATWQGWVVILLYLAGVITIAWPIEKTSNSLEEITFTFFVPLILMTAGLIAICFWKGEKPRWNWGKPKK